MPSSPHQSPDDVLLLAQARHQNHARTWPGSAPSPIAASDNACRCRKYWGNLTNRIYRYRSNRSEEHTSELQSLMRISYAVFCLKKKKHNNKKKKKRDSI